MKIKDVIIIDEHTLKLNQDAYKGDEIDLLEINNVDLSIINQKINEHKDAEYNRRFDSLKREWELTKQNAINEALRLLNEENIKLKRDLELVKESTRKDIESKYNLDIERLNNKINSLNKDLDNLNHLKTNEITLAVKSKEAEIKGQIYDLTTKLNNLESEKKQLQENLKLERQLALKNQEDQFQQEIKTLEEQLNNLKHEKSSINIKKMGEELEKWVDQEYQNYALNGFENSAWYKDNLVVKNTKADFIYKVFANDKKKDEDILTSIAIEVKSESPETVNKKKNSDHYAKLNDDRIKKSCEYALLISELEWDVVNDAPIRKVNDFDKMYLVRPQYFMVFIHIVTALSLKYKDILLEHNIQLEKFKDTDEILKEFEEMKSSILDTTIRYINTNIEDIIKSATNIITEGNKILDSAGKVKDTHLNTLINKISNLKLTKIIKNIENLEE